MFVGREERGDVRRNHRPHVGNLLDRALVSIHQPLERAEVPRQRQRGRLAHVADTEPVQQPRQRREIQARATIGAAEFAEGLTADLDSQYLGRAGTLAPLRLLLRGYWRVVRAALR